MPTTYRKNPTDGQQNVLEDVESQSGILTHEEGEVRVIVRENGAAERVAHAVGPVVSIGKNAGVSMPWDDKPGKFVGDTQGKA
jgi:hypothetical protein